MSDLALNYLGILMGMLSLLGIVTLIEWVPRIKAHVHWNNPKTSAKDISPTEQKLPNTSFNSTPNVERMIKELQEVHDNDNLN